MKRALLLLLWLAAGCTAADPTTGDLGDFDARGKTDTIRVEVAFEVGPAVDGVPGEQVFHFRTLSRLAVRTTQDGTAERLQVVAESATYRRRSWRGRSPYLTIPTDSDARALVAYDLTVLNWGTATARGKLTVETELPSEPGAYAVFNSPDCDDGCPDRAGGVRDTIVTTIQAAKETLDIAIYGIDDSTIVDAICNAAQAGVDVRVVTEDESADPDGPRSYYSALLDPDTGVVACGAEVVVVKNEGLMHHKFILADREGDEPVLLTGSTNFTHADLEMSHNHVVVVHGAPELMTAYQGELDQLLRHCATERLEQNTRCTECSAACVEDRSEEGPWTAGAEEISVHFSPSDDAMTTLRGAVITKRLSEPDAACLGDDATCVCRTAGASWSCDYCAQGEGGWGLIGDATDRVYVSIYSATDQCFALGLVRAAERGVEVLTIWDRVQGASMYSRDDYVCAEGVTTLVSKWSGGNAFALNHNKTVVVDDVVFDGSMNIGGSGATENDENTLVVKSPQLADAFAAYIDGEAALLERLGVTPRSPEQCRCTDLVDNDGDGFADARDIDCDSITDASGEAPAPVGGS